MSESKILHRRQESALDTAYLAPQLADTIDSIEGRSWVHNGMGQTSIGWILLAVADGLVPGRVATDYSDYPDQYRAVRAAVETALR